MFKPALRVIKGEDEPVTVRVVSRKGENALIEWGTPPRRAFMPLTELTLSADGKMATCRNPDEGMAYGAPWEEIIGRLEATPEDLARRLRGLGIWTVADLLARPNVLAGAIASTLDLDASKVMERAIAWSKQAQGE